MKTLVFLVFLVPMMPFACSSPAKDPAPESTVQAPVVPDQGALVNVQRHPTTFILPTPAGMTAVTEDPTPGSDIRSLRLYSKGYRTQILIAHLPSETGTPAGVLLRDAKAYRTQVAPHLPFPTITERDGGTVATKSHVAKSIRGGPLCSAHAYRKMDDVKGLVAVMTLAPGTVCAEAEAAAYATAKALRVE